MRAIRLTPVVAVGTLVLAGCSDGAGPSSSGTPGLVMTAPSVTTDTALAVLAQPITVLVRGADGRPAPGAVVRLAGPAAAGGQAAVYACGADERCAGTGAGAGVAREVAAGPDGRVTSHVRLGERAGATWLIVTAPGLGYRDSIAFITLPAAAVGVAVGVGDTLVAVGHDVATMGRVVDRHGNARTDAVTYVASAGATVDQDGRARALVPGLRTITARRGGWSRTATLRAVPDGMFAAIRSGDGRHDTVLVASFDGVVQRRLPIVWRGTTTLSLSRDASTVAYTDGGDVQSAGIGRIARLAVATGVVTYLAPTAADLRGASHAALSPDGTRIFFTGRQGDTNTVWRMASDGTGAIRLRPSAGLTASWKDWRPAVSPDGARVAFITDRVCCTERVQLLDANTGALTTLNEFAYHVRWSPDGQRLGILNGIGMRLMRPDGTGQQGIADPTRARVRDFDWTPDPAWVIGEGDFDLWLTNLETGESFLLPFTRGFVRPSVAR